ncbi:hypothetical protein ACT691_01305 [Vibrio metschnikovii]
MKNIDVIYQGRAATDCYPDESRLLLSLLAFKSVDSQRASPGGAFQNRFSQAINGELREYQ